MKSQGSLEFEEGSWRRVSVSTMQFKKDATGHAGFEDGRYKTRNKDNL